MPERDRVWRSSAYADVENDLRSGVLPDAPWPRAYRHAYRDVMEQARQMMVEDADREHRSRMYVRECIGWYILLGQIVGAPIGALIWWWS